MHPFTLIEQVWWLGPPAAIAIGIVLGASPLAWPLLAAASGVRAGTSEGGDPRTASRSVLLLGLGLTAVYGAVGASSGALERLVREGFGAWSGVGYVALAVLSAAAGVALLWRPTDTCRVLRTSRRGGPVTVLAGVGLGVVNCPACAGVITGVAVSAATLGSVTYAVVVMLALGVGHTLTLVLVSRLSLNPVRELARGTGTLQRIGGGLLVASAGWFTFQAVLGGVTVATPLP